MLTAIATLVSKCDSVEEAYDTVMCLKGQPVAPSETQLLLIALAKIVDKADSLQEVYEVLAKMAKSEGVDIEPFKGKTGSN
ncbi:MAG: hypothetical protein FWD98_00885 [Defluviitaleaceae bacterium]|nr:hypothetical protein [Defluviitaleaceae bacterium]